MEFLEDLDQSKQSAYHNHHHQMQQELRLLAEFRSLRLCRLLFLLFLLSLAVITSVFQSHIPVSIYAILAYFLVTLVLSEYTKKYKTQEFRLKSLRLRYHYQYNTLLTERLSFCFSFVLLAALQYAFLHTLLLGDPILTYSPAGFAFLQLLLRYPGSWLISRHMARKLKYQR